MKAFINGNVISAKHLMMTAKGILPPTVALRDINPIYAIDSEGKRTDTIIAYRYNCVDLETLSTFTVKVESSKPIISEEDLEFSEDIIMIDIPVNETLIKPYEISYGKAKISIVAPLVKIHKS